MPFNLKNFDIDKFNRDVNKSCDPDAQYNSWAAYRAKIAEFIAGALENLPGAKSMTVFGAGNLNDIDMRLLSGKLEKIVLSDADVKSIKDGLVRHGISEEVKSKVKIRQDDYTGAQKSGLFTSLEMLARKAAPADELVNCIERTLPQMMPDASNEKFDIVISCPVYTQLVYTQIEVLLKILYEYGIYEYHELNKILNMAYNLMPGVISNYNDLVINACNEDGRIILLTDIIEMQKGSAVYKKTRALGKNDRIGRREAEKLIKKYGIELAQTGLADFKIKTLLTRDIYTIWPFNEQKEYLVYACISEKPYRNADTYLPAHF